MATVTKSVGTTSRDYSTITLWEADLDDDPIYDAADDAIGECYDDSVFDEIVVMNGGTTIGLNSSDLTVASAERHDGTAGTGARIIRSSNTTSHIIFMATSNAFTRITQWLEASTSAPGFSTNGISVATGGTTGANNFRNCIVHGFFNSVGGAGVRCVDVDSAGTIRNVTNNLIYNIDYDGSSDISTCVGVQMGSGNKDSKFQNNTVFDITITRATSTATVEGYHFINDDAQSFIQNNIVVTVTTAGSGAAICYSDSAPANATVDHNLASDTTASGTGSLDSKSAANQFVSTTGGSEDLHLKSGADAIDAGVDLVTTPSGVEIDIDGRDRDAEGDTWDMGADEFVAAVAAAVSLVMAPYLPAQR